MNCLNKTNDNFTKKKEFKKPFLKIYKYPFIKLERVKITFVWFRSWKVLLVEPCFLKCNKHHHVTPYRVRLFCPHQGEGYNRYSDLWHKQTSRAWPGWIFFLNNPPGFQKWELQISFGKVIVNWTFIHQREVNKR